MDYELKSIERLKQARIKGNLKKIFVCNLNLKIWRGDDINVK